MVVSGQTTVYHYDQWNSLTQESSTSGTAQRTYVFAGMSPVGQLDHGSPNKTTFLFSDHLGTPRTGRDTARQIVWSWRSDAFGSTSANADPDGNSVLNTVNLRFAGQYFDSESNLHNNFHRTYDPKVGRYLQSDPIGLAGGINTYAYVENNPVRFIDPTGLIICYPWGCKGDAELPPTDRRDPIKPDKPKRPKCADSTGDFVTCMSCCNKIEGNLASGGGSACAEECYRKQGISKVGGGQCGG